MATDTKKLRPRRSNCLVQGRLRRTSADRGFVVDPARPSEFKGSWSSARRSGSPLFWRSRADNPVNDFYFDEADGCLKGEKWNVFWYGLSGFDEIRYAVDHCQVRPATLKG